MRSLAAALEAYYVDNQAYPPCAKGAQGANGFLKPNDPAYNIYTFALRPAADGKASSPYLTTPVAYISSLLSDPLALSRGASSWISSRARKFEIQNSSGLSPKK